MITTTENNYDQLIFGFKPMFLNPFCSYGLGGNFTSPCSILYLVYNWLSHRRCLDAIHHVTRSLIKK